jgi:hypothetical protein
MNIVGPDEGLCVNGGSADIDIPSINTEMPYIPDPLADIPEPEIPGPNLGAIKSSGYFPPGYYKGGVDAKSQTKVCLGPEFFPCPPPPDFEPDFTTDEPAIYYLEGPGMEINGGATIYAYQVMIFIKRGRLRLNGNGSQIIIPADIDLGGQYGGITFFQARDNTTASTINGTDDTILKGTWYFPAAKLNLGGNGITTGNQLITWQLEIFGTGEWTINYDGRNPAPGTEVFLVF